MEKKRLLNMSDSMLDKTVKIANTKFDRRRKLSDSQINRIINKYIHGETVVTLAREYGISNSAVKYHVDENYKNYKNSLRKYYKNNSRDNREDRVAYKRRLVKAGAGIIINN